MYRALKTELEKLKITASLCSGPQFGLHTKSGFWNCVPGDRRQSFGEIRRKIITLLYQKIAKNVSLSFTSCLASTAMAFYWVINAQHSCFSDVPSLETRGCNSVKVIFGISWWFCVGPCSFKCVCVCVCISLHTHTHMCMCTRRCVWTYPYRQAGLEGKECFYCKSFLSSLLQSA